MPSKMNKKVSLPKEVEVPYDIKEGTGIEEDTVKYIINKITGKKIGKIIDRTNFSDTGPAFKAEWEEPYIHLNSMFLPRFDTFEKAAVFLFNVCVAADSCRKNIPVNDDVLDIIKYEARLLQDDAKIVRDMAFNVYHKQRTLRHAIEKFGIQDLIWEIDYDNDLKAFLEFKREGSDIPFFSESVLYELIGKEDARTVLALLKKVIAKIDPVLVSEV